MPASTLNNTTFKHSRLGIGPMSKQVVDSAIEFADENDYPIMLIASRNQVDSYELGGGYANNWSTQDFAKYVESQNEKQNVILCRDHCGPYFRAGEREDSLEVAVGSAKKTLKADIDSGFQILHIDTCYCSGQEIEIAKDLVEFARNYASSQYRDISFEVGTDENTGHTPDPSEFKKQIEALVSFVQPHFIVGQTGSLTKETFQVGSFDFTTVSELCEIANSFGIQFKEHNCDYVAEMELSLRNQAGVGAVNVAPEFGVIQTRVTSYWAQKIGLIKELKNFESEVLVSRKWDKWAYGPFSDTIKFICAGHYCFMSPAYQDLIGELNEHVDIDLEIKVHLKQAIARYATVLK